MYQDDPWAGFEPVAPAGPPAIPRVIQGPPREPPPQTADQAIIDRNRARAGAMDIPQAQAQLEHTQLENANLRRQTDLRTTAQSSHQEEAANVLDAIRDARHNISGWSTGLPGQVLQNLGGSQAHDLQSSLNTVVSNVGFDRLQQMRAESPTGGALGQVSDFENRMLQSSLAALNQSQSREQLERNLEQVEFHYLNVLNTIQGQQPFHNLEEARRAYGQANSPHMVGYVPLAQRRPDQPENPLSDEQQRLYDAFLSQNPNATADQLREFAARTGLGNISNAEQIIEARRHGAGFRPGSEARLPPENVSDARGPGTENRQFLENSIASATPFVGPAVSAMQGTFGTEPANAFARGMYDVPTLGLSDEGRAIADTAQGGTLAGNLRHEQAIDDFDWQNHTGSRLAGELTGGAFLPSQVNTVRGGFAFGGLYGLGSGRGGLGDRALSGAAGALVGGGTNALLGRLGPGARPPSSSGGGPTPGEIGNALVAEEIPAARPIADPSARGGMAYLETTRGGHDIVQDSLEATRQGIQTGVQRQRGPGSVQTPGGMGETIQGAGRRRLDTLRERARSFYDRGSSVAGNLPVQPREMVAKLDTYIQRLSRNPASNRGVLAYLRSVRGDLVDEAGNLRPKTMADIRDIRTGLNDEINRRNLLRTRAEAVMGEVLKSGSQDIQRDISQAAPAALRLYQRGDALWSQLHRDEREVVSRLIGPADNQLSGEQVLSRVTNMMGNRGDLARFRRTVSMMTPEERGDFVATLVEPMGRRSAEEPFSPALFLSHTASMQDDALRTLFGRDGAQSIRNLRLAATGFRDASNSLNRSRSGFVQNFKDIVSTITNVRSLTGAGLGFAVGGIPGAAAGAVAGETLRYAGNRISARTLMNTEVSSWLSRVARTQGDRQARRLLGQLPGIAARNPAISQEVLGLRQVLVNAANDNFSAAGRVAASPDERPNQQQ